MNFLFCLFEVIYGTITIERRYNTMYQTRRKKLMASLPDCCIALFFSGKAPYKVGDEKYEFSVDRNFYYLTGLTNEHMILALVNINAKLQEYIFIEQYDEEIAKWIGGRMLPEDVEDISGIENIIWIDEAMETICSCLSSLFSTTSQTDVYADFTKQEAYQEDTQAIIFTRDLLKQHPYIQLHNIAPYTTALRLMKDEDEVAKLKKAIEVTKNGIECMMANAKSNMMEYQLEAFFDFILKTNHCEHSFPSIIAGGKNAVILHYSTNDRKIKNNTLVLCDLGASYAYMNADITRTFPINGKFTKRQKEIYNVVLEGNKYIMSLVKPGITLRYLNNELIKFYHDKLNDLHLLKHGKTVSDYYWHSVSHMLGLETHDVTIRDYKLQIGTVFTIEPGLYIEDEQIGIRIEDNVIVTEDGCLNLSAEIIKEVDEIEYFMSQHQE